MHAHQWPVPAVAAAVAAAALALAEWAAELVARPVPVGPR